MPRNLVEFADLYNNCKNGFVCHSNWLVKIKPGLAEKKALILLRGKIHILISKIHNLARFSIGKTYVKQRVQPCTLGRKRKGKKVRRSTKRKKRIMQRTYKKKKPKQKKTKQKNRREMQTYKKKKPKRKTRKECRKMTNQKNTKLKSTKQENRHQQQQQQPLVKLNSQNPETWEMTGIEKRWNRLRRTRDGMIVFAVIQKKHVPQDFINEQQQQQQQNNDNVHQDYTNGLKRHLIEHYQNVDARYMQANPNVGGNEANQIYPGYALYITFVRE